jgi:hypothetical protein
VLKDEDFNSANCIQVFSSLVLSVPQFWLVSGLRGIHGPFGLPLALVYTGGSN